MNHSARAAGLAVFLMSPIMAIPVKASSDWLQAEPAYCSRVMNRQQAINWLAGLIKDATASYPEVADCLKYKTKAVCDPARTKVFRKAQDLVRSIDLLLGFCKPPKTIPFPLLVWGAEQAEKDLGIWYIGR